ncbi:MAG TPA: 2Fe-2S iron-sulfur cluster-binding protein [Sphingomicrobium sp.]|nr:2Fe-2S iron-sulfur cluster-binding protein [Sphingomicrobium sp.]
MSVHFHSLKIAEVVPETAEAVSLRFEIPPELEEAFAFKPGQHLTLRAMIDGEEVRRNYSLCTAPDERDWMVTIKRMPGGFFSQWAPQNLKAGDVVEVMSPHGSFTTEFDAANRRHLVGIAGGSGITPVLSLIKSTLRLEPESRFTLLYGNRDSSSIIFLDALADLKDKYLDRFELYHFLDQEEQEIDLFNGMLDRGIAKERIHIERFTAETPPGAVTREIAVLQTRAEGLTVSVTLDGRTRRVPFTAGNILDSARASGLPAPFACKAGVCATCRAKVTKGKVEMAARYGLTDEEVAAGYVLTCQSVPLGDGVAVDYDA